MSERRAIRLKETARDIDVMRERPDGYLEQTDGTVGDGPWRTRTDAHGFIMTGNDIPAHAPKVVFLGDSFVEAMYTPEDTRFVSIVERDLEQRGVPLKCLNAGYSGSTTLQLFNVFMNKIVPLVGEGGAVVFFVPQSDLPIYFRPQSYWYPNERYSPVVPPPELDAEGTPRGSAVTGAILGLLISAAREFGIRLVLVSSPHRHVSEWGDDEYLSRMVPKEQQDSLNQRRDDLRAAIQAVVEDTRVPFIDADAQFMQAPEMFYDELHLNDDGHRRFAAWFANKLMPLVAPETEQGRPSTPPRTTVSASYSNAAYAADFYLGHCPLCDAVWHPDETYTHVCASSGAV